MKKWLKRTSRLLTFLHLKVIFWVLMTFYMNFLRILSFHHLLIKMWKLSKLIWLIKRTLFSIIIPFSQGLIFFKWVNTLFRMITMMNLLVSCVVLSIRWMKRDITPHSPTCNFCNWTWRRIASILVDVNPISSLTNNCRMTMDAHASEYMGPWNHQWL